MSHPQLEALELGGHGSGFFNAAESALARIRGPNAAPATGSGSGGGGGAAAAAAAGGASVSSAASGATQQEQAEAAHTWV